MSLKDLREARVRVEYIPAHKYVGVWEERARNYGEFWRYHDCDSVCGTVESLRSLSHPVVASHTAGWWYPQGERRYFYGFPYLPTHPTSCSIKQNMKIKQATPPITHTYTNIKTEQKGHTHRSGLCWSTTSEYRACSGV